MILSVNRSKMIYPRTFMRIQKRNKTYPFSDEDN